MRFYSLTKSIVFRPQGQAGKGLMSALVLEALVQRPSRPQFLVMKEHRPKCLVTIQIPPKPKDFKCPLYQLFSEAAGCLPDYKLGL